MLKIVTSEGPDFEGRHTLWLGLSHRNLELLRADQPIAFDAKEVRLPGWQIVIFAGETEEAMIDRLREHNLPLPKEAPGPGEEVRWERQ